MSRSLQAWLFPLYVNNILTSYIFLSITFGICFCCRRQDPFDSYCSCLVSVTCRCIKFIWIFNCLSTLLKNTEGNANPIGKKFNYEQHTSVLRKQTLIMEK